MSSNQKKETTANVEATAKSDLQIHALVIAFVSLVGLGFSASQFFATSQRASELEKQKIQLEQKFEGYRDGARDVAR